MELSRIEWQKLISLLLVESDNGIESERDVDVVSCVVR